MLPATLGAGYSVSALCGPDVCELHRHQGGWPARDFARSSDFDLGGGGTHGRAGGSRGKAPRKWRARSCGCRVAHFFFALLCQHRSGPVLSGTADSAELALCALPHSAFSRNLFFLLSRQVRDFKDRLHHPPPRSISNIHVATPHCHSPHSLPFYAP